MLATDAQLFLGILRQGLGTWPGLGNALRLLEAVQASLTWEKSFSFSCKNAKSSKVMDRGFLSVLSFFRIG